MNCGAVASRGKKHCFSVFLRKKQPAAARRAQKTPKEPKDTSDNMSKKTSGNMSNKMTMTVAAQPKVQRFHKQAYIEREERRRHELQVAWAAAKVMDEKRMVSNAFRAWRAVQAAASGRIPSEVVQTMM